MDIQYTIGHPAYYIDTQPYTTWMPNSDTKQRQIQPLTKRSVSASDYHTPSSAQALSVG